MKADKTTTEIDVKNLMKIMGEQAREAYRLLADASPEQKNAALLESAKEIRAQSEQIIAANDADMFAAENAGLTDALLDRLKLKPESIEAMSSRLFAIASIFSGFSFRRSSSAFAKPEFSAANISASFAAIICSL